MRTTLELCAKELRLYFYSPIAWLVLGIFAVHSTLLYFRAVLETGSSFDGFWLSAGLLENFLNPRTGMAQYMFLYTSLLTMGLLSSEYGEGSIRLLFSSPVRLRDIVLGKYAAAMVYGLLMIGIIGVLVLLTRIFLLSQVDLPLLFADLLMFYLLIGLYMAIGLFVSSLTAYPLIAATGTMAVLFGLQHYVQTLTVDGFPAVLQHLFSVWLPPYQHLHLRGLLNSVDLAYFAVSIMLFLTLTLLRLRSLHESRPTWVHAVRYSLAVGAMCLCGWILCRPAFFHFFDLTAARWWTATPAQQQAMHALKSPLKVYRYFNVLENPRTMQPSNVYKLESASDSFSLRGNFRMDTAVQYVPYYAHTDKLHPELRKDADRVAEDLHTLTTNYSYDQLKHFPTQGMDIRALVAEAGRRYAWLRGGKVQGPEAFARLMEDFRGQGYEQYRGYKDFLVFESGGRRALLPTDYFSHDLVWLPFMGDMAQQALMGILRRLALSPLKVGFVTGHGEREPMNRGPEGYSTLFAVDRMEGLVNFGFEVVALSLSEPVAADIDILVLADPRQALAPAELEQINRYRERGGNLLVLGDPGRAGLVNPAIAGLGVQLTGAQPDKYAQIVAGAVKVSDDASQGILTRHVLYQGIYSPFDRPPDLLDPYGHGYELAMGSAAALKYDTPDSYTVQPLASDSGSASIVALRRPVPGEPGREQRIVISGSAAFMQNSGEGVGYFSAMHAGGGERIKNLDFIASLFYWLSADELPARIDRSRSHEYLKCVAVRCSEELSALRERLRVSHAEQTGEMLGAYAAWLQKPLLIVQKSTLGFFVLALLLIGYPLLTQRRRR